MEKHLLLKSVLLIFCAMLLFNFKPSNDLEYTASRFNFYEVSNKILISELDSIVLSDNSCYLNDFNPQNKMERIAIRMIKDTIRMMGLKEKEITIKRKINDRREQMFSSYFCDPQDSIIAFKIYHVDGYVYHHNKKKLNAAHSKNLSPDGVGAHVIGMTGNLSGINGVYFYNQNRNRLYILKSQ